MSLPEGLHAVQDGGAREWCARCVEKAPAVLEHPDSTPVFAPRDTWYPGGECAGCGEVINGGWSFL